MRKSEMTKKKKRVIIIIVCITAFLAIAFFAAYAYIRYGKKVVFGEVSPQGNVEVKIRGDVCGVTEEYEIIIKEQGLFKPVLLKEKFINRSGIKGGIDEDNVEVEWLDNKVLVKITFNPLNVERFSYYYV